MILGTKYRHRKMERQPFGYYRQQRTQPKHMNPTQRWIHSMGGILYYSSCFPEWPIGSTGNREFGAMTRP